MTAGLAAPDGPPPAPAPDRASSALPRNDAPSALPRADAPSALAQAGAPPGPPPDGAPPDAAAAGLAAILAALGADARVAGLALREDRPGRPVVLVTPDAAWLAGRRAAESATLSRQRSRQWEMIYDRAFLAEGPSRPPDFTTWISSLTRAPIPPASMQAWLDATLARLRAVPHARVLDLGCGIGLVVAALAPDCREYLALDASGEAIATLGAWTRTQPRLAHVRLAHRPAHDLADIPAGSVDLVVLNSVVQYFPDLDYLTRVLHAASRCLAPGGRIFLGDLRTRALLPVHAATLALAHAPGATGAAELRDRQAAILAAGRELAIDPGLLAASPPLLPRLSAVRFGLKPAAADPELAAFRFDAMLELDGPRAAAAPPLAWDAAAGDEDGTAALDRLAHRLEHEARPAVVVIGLPNARTARDAALARHLADAAPGTTAAMLAAMPDPPPTAGIEPEALLARMAALGYAAELRPSPGSAEGRFDALLHRPVPTPDTPAPAWPAAAPPASPATDPLAAELADGLRSALQRLADTLAPRGTVAIRIAPPRVSSPA